MNKPNIKIIAHRGNGPTSAISGNGAVVPENLAPENTLKAFREAVRQGADGIEFDVYITADGEAVVIHDDELNKNVEGANRTGKDLGNVSDKSLAELKAYNVGQGEQIPSLRETLDFFVAANDQRRRDNKPSLIINIELKDIEPKKRDVGDTCAEILNEYISGGLLNASDVVFCSFDHAALGRLKDQNPDFQIAPNLKTKSLFGEHNILMPGWHVKEGASYDPNGLDYLKKFHRAHGCHALDPVLWDVYYPLVELAKDEGLSLYISTSDLRTFHREHFIGLLAIAQSGVPIVFKTDEPALAMATLNELWQTQQQALETPIHAVSGSEIISTGEMDAASPASRFHLAQIDLLRRVLKRPFCTRPKPYSAQLAKAELAHT